ncbi:SUMF1/EgtB/PvdO family nonheme iron enzyme [Myxococcus sp. CA051A]|uniref:protein kinase domain-containing protein n=1 Tax=Myxococcus sp. CA051A TaxID=2741739 RepID=UPI00157B1C7A|nr:SUMF1/EgtB/PvdO family nonheme iron enzyme [Myxococcus sp. CA051A]NTX65973.1 SUMF1/EgtB/PvdO family nonheme iron enzyme [Myxococcus sp. CA051A]
MLCYRCGSHVPETTDTCPTCGMKYDAAARQSAGVVRKRGLEGAPYKPGDVVAGRYAIQEVVGSGPMGFVFRAQDEEIDVEVALKTVHPRLVQQPEERTQFSFSMRVGKKLNHPNLLRVYEEGLDGERPFFTMQLLEGMTLRRMMEQRASRGQLFSLKDVEPLLAQMAAALDAAHRFGPHSDLKPENVIVLPDLLKVTDYGLGLAVPQLPFVQAQKGHRADIYVAPEYVAGGELDTRMDVYSLGVVMGEMVAGLVPVEGVVPGLTSLHPDLPTSFEALYRRALNINPLARPKTAGELHAEFASILARAPAAVATHVRGVPPPAGSAQAAAVRMSARPPPPVPTDMMPVPTGIVTSAPKPSAPVEEEPPPPDATQPLDAATLAAIIGANPGASQHLTEQALPFITASAARAAMDSPQGGRSASEASAKGRAASESSQGGRSSRGASEPAHGGRLPPEPARAGGPAPRASGPMPAAQPRAAPRAQESDAGQESAPAVSGARSARALESSPSASGPRPMSRTLDAAPAVPVPAIRTARTLESPAVSGARTGPRSLDFHPSMSGARTLDSPMTSAARSAPRIAPTHRATRPSKSSASRRRSAFIWMVVLTVGGLALGAGGGYLLLRYLRSAQRTAPVVPMGGPSARQAAPEANAPPLVALAGGCPDGMRLVSGGFFRRGKARDDDQGQVEEPFEESIQVGSFCMDEFEYSNSNKRGGSPRVEVTWEQARGLCEAAEKRLCTEEEWEKACKGPGNARYAYGDDYVQGACNTKVSLQETPPTVAPSGTFTQCVSRGYGVADLSGNVAEWTSTRVPNRGVVQKGGSFNDSQLASRCSARAFIAPEKTALSVGFRCCASVKP